VIPMVTHASATGDTPRPSPKIATSLDGILFYSTNNAKSISLAREQALVSDVFRAAQLPLYAYFPKHKPTSLSSLSHLHILQRRRSSVGEDLMLVDIWE